MNEVKIKIDFTNGTLEKIGIPLISGDYNTTKLVFEFDKDYTDRLVFEMGKPNGALCFVEEIEGGEVVLVGQDEQGNPCSVFDMAGRYTFEVSMYKYGGGKLTSVSGSLMVLQEEVVIDDDVVTPYLPIFDTLMQEVERINISAEKEGHDATVIVTDRDGEEKEFHIYDGAGIVSAVVNDDGDLIITYEDGRVEDAGKVVGNDGVGIAYTEVVGTHLIVHYTDGRVEDAGDIVANKQDTIQFSSMPVPSVENEGRIIQFVGATTADYINGYWYKCIEENGTYLWEMWTKMPPVPRTWREIKQAVLDGVIGQYADYQIGNVLTVGNGEDAIRFRIIGINQERVESPKYPAGNSLTLQAVDCLPELREFDGDSNNWFNSDLSAYLNSEGQYHESGGFMRHLQDIDAEFYNVLGKVKKYTVKRIDGTAHIDDFAYYAFIASKYELNGGVLLFPDGEIYDYYAGKSGDELLASRQKMRISESGLVSAVYYTRTPQDWNDTNEFSVIETGDIAVRGAVGAMYAVCPCVVIC